MPSAALGTAYGGGGRTTCLVCGYLACDARLARMLLQGLPPLLRVNVRGSSAGIWLESSVKYALAEARSPRPGGAGVLASNLLRRSNAPLAHIAEAVGYQTDTAFSRAFRREFGSPPAAWRRDRTVTHRQTYRTV